MAQYKSVQRLQKRPYLAAAVGYTLLFALLMGYLSAQFFLNGKSFLWFGDTYKQHYIALMYYGRWLRTAARCLLTGVAIPTWDMSIGYGSDIITTLSYYVIGDPLNLLSAAVPSRYTEQLLEALVVLRGWLAGLAFLAYSRHHKNSAFGSMLGAISYVFCGWFLRCTFWEPLFIVPMYCFPLVLLGADYLFEKKSPLPYVAAIALAVASNFLFFYMIAVLLVGYDIAKYAWLYWQHKKQGTPAPQSLLGLVLQFFGYSLLGISIAGATILPTVQLLFGSVRSSVVRQVSSYPYENRWLFLGGLTNSVVGDNYSTYVGINALAVLALLLLFAKRKQHPLLRIAAVTMVVIAQIPLAGVALNGFSYAQNRWVWAFALLESFVLARLFPELTRLDTTEKLRLLGLLVLYLGLLFTHRQYYSEELFCVASCALILITLALYLFTGHAGTSAAGRTILLLGCCMGILAEVYYGYSPEQSDAVFEYYNTDFAWQRGGEGNPANVLQLTGDTGVYRFDNALGMTQNEAMLAGEHGLGYFFSLNNGYISQWMEEQALNFAVEFDYSDLDRRSVLNSFVGAKYFLKSENDSETQLPVGVAAEPVVTSYARDIPVGVHVNEAALPIGVATDSVISRDAYEMLSAIEKQDVLLSAMVLDEADASATVQPRSEVVKPAFTVDYVGEVIVQEEEHGTTYISPRDGARIVLTVTEPIVGMETYLVVEGMRYDATNPMDAITPEEWAQMDKAARKATRQQYKHFWEKDFVYLGLYSNIGDSRIEYYRPNSQYYGDRHNFAKNYGITEEGLSVISVVLPWAGVYHFDRLDIECQPVDNLTERAAAFGAEHLENTVLSTNALSGDITVSSDKYLLMQLPYSKGWSAAVDGVPTEILQADTAFMAIPLAAGSHHVEFRYRTPGLVIGLGCTAVGVIGFAVLAALELRKRRAACKAV